MASNDLVSRWLARADELEPYAPAAAEAFRRAAAELEAERRANDDPVTLREASLAGGYSVDHLQRLVAAGTLENIGRKNRPRIRRADIPVKPGRGLPSAPDGAQFSARRRIVASVSTHSKETP
jgi:hypothetical protein